MINRANWKLVQEYLEYRKDVDLLADNSLGLEETWLRHLLEWAQETTFDNASKIRPTLPEYVLDARLDGSGQALSYVYVRKIIRSSYNFLRWLRTHKRGFGSLDHAWLDTLKPPRMTIEPKEHEIVTIEEIKAIAKAPVQTMREKRIRAAVVLWFLSGIRIGAFVTLPIKALDLENRSIRQWPKLGVRTKNKKHATTYLLNIPELLEVVKDWDDFVRSQLTNDHPWFANISPETGKLDQDNSFIGENRHHGARKDLKEWLEKVGLPYHSPHKFRHGFAVYSLKHAKDISQLKAISQNMMHANISITDGIYGGLSDSDVKDQISSLTDNSLPDEKEYLIELLRINREIENKIERKFNS
jgi:integrase